MSRTVSHDEMIEETFRKLQVVTSQIEMSLRSALSERGVSLSGLMMLRILISRGGPTTATMLADSMMVSKGAIAMFIHQLETAGFITRARMPLDRRVILVTPTEKARVQFERLHSLATDELTRLFNGWGAPDIKTLQRLVNQLAIQNRERRPETLRTDHFPR